MIPKERTLTETQMNAMTNPPVGIVYYNIDRKIPVMYNGTYWISMITGEQLWSIFLNDNFSSLSGWTSVDDTNNAFEVGTVGAYNGSSAYVSNDGGTSRNYDDDEVCHIYKDINIPSGITKWRAVWIWEALGEVGYDYGQVWLNTDKSTTPSASTEVSQSAVNILLATHYDQAGYVTSSETFTDYIGTGVRFIISGKSEASSWSGAMFPPLLSLGQFKIETL